METIVIIGGGASGLVAGITAKTPTNEVIILEKNTSCGKKILATGNGHCNYYNDNQKLTNYHSTNNDLIEKLITEDNLTSVRDFFTSLGIIPKIKNGYYYPTSNQASSIRNALLEKALSKKVTIKTNFLVIEIFKKDKFYIHSTDETIIADKLIIATGGAAAPKTGSDGAGYSFAKEFGHTIIKPLPALVQLKANLPFAKEVSGVRTDVNLTLYEDTEKIKEESGELQITDYGLSGICIFNLSSLISRGLDEGKKELISIDFLPFISDKKTWLKERSITYADEKVSNDLEKILNYKLVTALLKNCHLKESITYKELTLLEKGILLSNLCNFKVQITGTNTFYEAQTVTGGIPLTEVNLETMESLKCQNLYITGELLDIDGICGGYNLTVAWLTGLLAGKNIKDDKNA